jgi:hypothetical protein
MEHPMRLKMIALSLALLALPLAASAHNLPQGPHGGQVVADGAQHLEFVSMADQIVLYVTDTTHGPLSSEKATGRVIIQEGTKLTTVELAPVEPNLLNSKLAAPLGAGAKLAVTVKLGDGRDVKARFVVP